MKQGRWYLLSALLLGCLFLISWRVGGESAGLDSAVLTQLRLPRLLAAVAVGMGLSLAGAVMQSVFANSLCEPYTLGISSGASLGAVVGTSLGLSLDFMGIAGGAFVGALAFMLVLYVMASKRDIGNASLLLVGVMLGLFGSSLVTLWMAMSEANGIQGAIFWLLGDLSRVRLHGSLLLVAGVIALGAAVYSRHRALDALMLGEQEARSLGIDFSAERRRLIFLVSLLVALCVSASGMIGFVGLVVPHFARKLMGALHGRMLPLAALWGAIALLLADFSVRNFAQPYEIPVGVVCALVGTPLFAWIFLKREAV
ncbi:MAG: FecCD family ABC transporter permease [Bacteriovoracia bacterium]